MFDPDVFEERDLAGARMGLVVMIASAALVVWFLWWVFS